MEKNKTHNSKGKKKSYNTLEKTKNNRHQSYYSTSKQVLYNYLLMVMNDLSSKGAARIFLWGFDIQTLLQQQVMLDQCSNVLGLVSSAMLLSGYGRARVS
ncbi:hypothetical protein YC2023_098200 [Brassica napus]